MNRFWQHPRFVASAQISGYALFFLATLVFALPLTFPTRPLRGLLTRLAAQQGYPLAIEEVRLGMLGGVSLRGVALTLPGKAGEPGENGQVGAATPEVTLQLDAISARVGLLPLLSGKVDVRFDVEAGGGKIEGGRFVRMGDAFDLDIEQIADLSLQGLGVGPRLLPSQHMSGALGGELAGKLSVHYGGSTDDMKGAIELDLADAMLQAPRLTMQGGLELADLPLGMVHLKVKMDLRQHLTALSQERGSDKDTVIHIEQLESSGAQVDLLTEETSHIRIPPGKLGWKQAQIQLHFAFSIHDKPKEAKAKDGDEESGEETADAKAAKKAEDANKDRLQWAAVLSMAGSKIKPFERGGFIGVTCTGPVARPQCKLDIPRVTTGTRAGAGMRADAPKGGTGADGDKPGSDKGEGDRGESDKPVEAPPPMEFKPVPRLESPPPPVAAVPTPPSEPPPPVEPPSGRPPPSEPPPQLQVREEKPAEDTERPPPERKVEEPAEQEQEPEGERPRGRGNEGGEEGGEGEAPQAEEEE